MIKIRNLELDIRKENEYYIFQNKRFDSIEKLVIFYYERLGYVGVYTENTYWKSLFSMFYNNVIIQKIENEVIYEFDFQRYDDLKKLFNKKYIGFYYHYFKVNFEILFKFLDTDSFLKLLFYYNLQQSGYPDVMLSNGQNLLFLEVKNKNDMLRESQAKTLQVLKMNNVNVEICTINFSERRKGKILEILEDNKNEAKRMNSFLQNILKINLRKKEWYEKTWVIVSVTLLLFPIWFITIPVFILLNVMARLRDKSDNDFKEKMLLMKLKNKGSK